MNQNSLEAIKKLVLPLLAERDVELVDLLGSRERGRSCLRFLVDKSGGITLDECAQLNQEIGQMLDEEDIVQENYALEVSSPGLNRPLVSTRDFQRVQNQSVKIVLHQPIKGQNVWIGVLEEVDEENVAIQTENKQRLCIPRSKVARANLEIRFG